MGQPAEALSNYDPLNEQHVRDAFMQAIAAEAARADALTEAYGRAPETVSDDTTASKTTDLAKQLGACARAIEAKRKEHKGRYDTCGAVIHTAATYYTNNLAKLKKACETRLTDYQRRIAEVERKRREEEAERLRKEAAEREASLHNEDDLEEAIRAGAEAERAAKEAEAKAADLTKARGEFGSVASLRTFWTFEIEDIHAVPLETLRRHFTPDAIEKAVRAYVRDGGRELPGVRIFETQETRVR